MNKRWIAGAAFAAMTTMGLAPTTAAAADNGPWMVRVRAVNLDSANKDSTGLNLSINDKVIPEVDISYYFSPNVAAELVLTYPQKHDLRSNGGAIGSLKHLPPVLSLQYHFTGMSLKPYVGLGLNYTHFSSVNFAPAVVTALHPSIDRNSFGVSLQAGVDMPLGNGWYVNADLKKVQLSTDVASSGTKVGTFKVNPWLFALGVGTRF